MQPISKQWLGKQVPTETDLRAATEEWCFLWGSMVQLLLWDDAVNMPHQQ
jgi:hypothetical protein